MTKAQLEEILSRFLKAAPAIIVSARSHTLNRRCMICGAGQGVQHDEGCALWELVAARIDFRRLSDGPARPNKIAPDYVMATLEAGAQFAPSETSLALARGGPR